MKKRYSLSLVTLLLGGALGALVFAAQPVPPVPATEVSSSDWQAHAITLLTLGTSELGLHLYDLALQYLRQ